MRSDQILSRHSDGIHQNIAQDSDGIFEATCEFDYDAIDRDAFDVAPESENESLAYADAAA